MIKKKIFYKSLELILISNYNLFYYNNNNIKYCWNIIIKKNNNNCTNFKNNKSF